MRNYTILLIVASVLLTSCKDDILDLPLVLPLTNNLVKDVRAYDLDNSGNSSDIRIDFDVIDNLNVTEYRVLVIPFASSNSFDESIALEIPEASYLLIPPDTSNNEYSIKRLPSNLLDVNGDQIHNDVEYVVAVLVMGTGKSQLSLFSISFTLLEMEVEMILSDEDYLIFGHFFGFCGGEGCVEIFKLENNNLLEDINDEFVRWGDYYNGNYNIDLGIAKFDQVKDLINYFPSNLLLDINTVFGCPNCVDQGGLYIEYNVKGLHDFWIIDYFQSEVPSYLQEFIIKVKEKIALINN